LILSGDHIYTMDYAKMIRSHIDRKADLTMATIEVPIEEAHRFGIVGVDENDNVISFVEKPSQPNLI
jgi:glucose-1-phosphate adenylyltransferase